MKKILIDTNIILDIALERGAFFEKTAELFKIIEQKEIRAFLSATTITDIYYILKKSKNHEVAIDFLNNLFEYVEIVGVDKYAIINALNSEMKDFEDAVQAEIAKEHSIKTVITRNEKDFEKSDLDIYNPTEFIQFIKKK